MHRARLPFAAQFRDALGVLLLIVHPVSAAAVTSDTAFDTLKGLQGKWAIQSDGKTLPIQMSYDNGSKNSIVTEGFGKELSVFYRNGQALEMIHFCNRGNQPRLRLKEDTRPGVLEFETFAVTNLGTASADHVQRIIYRILDENRIDLEIVWQVDNSQKSEKYTLTRQLPVSHTSP